MESGREHVPSVEPRRSRSEGKSAHIHMTTMCSNQRTLLPLQSLAGNSAVQGLLSSGSGEGITSSPAIRISTTSGANCTVHDDNAPGMVRQFVAPLQRLSKNSALKTQQAGAKQGATAQDVRESLHTLTELEVLAVEVIKTQVGHTDADVDDKWTRLALKASLSLLGRTIPGALARAIYKVGGKLVFKGLAEQLAPSDQPPIASDDILEKIKEGMKPVDAFFYGTELLVRQNGLLRHNRVTANVGQDDSAAASASSVRNALSSPALQKEFMAALELQALQGWLAFAAQLDRGVYEENGSSGTNLASGSDAILPLLSDQFGVLRVRVWFDGGTPKIRAATLDEATPYMVTMIGRQTLGSLRVPLVVTVDLEIASSEHNFTVRRNEVGAIFVPSFPQPDQYLLGWGNGRVQADKNGRNYYAFDESVALAGVHNILKSLDDVKLEGWLKAGLLTGL